MTSSRRRRSSPRSPTRTCSRRRTGRSSAGRRRRIAAKGAGPRPLPQRTCVACRTERAKRDLLRVVRGPDGTLSVDARGKAPGRGAYLCADPACIGRGLRDGSVARALEVPVEPADADRLAAELELTGQARQKGGR